MRRRQWASALDWAFAAAIVWVLVWLTWSTWTR